LPACTPLAIASACALFALTTGVSIPVEDLQFEGTVAVGPDGNGWVAARFPTTVDGSNVIYYFDVSIGEGIKALGVTLNGEVVLRTASLPPGERTRVVLNLVGTSDNEIMVSVEGIRGAVARFAVVAVSGGE
jgi:hypothetical protein